MSPIATVAARTAARRQFSLYKSLRNVARGMETHPFERLPMAQKPAAGDWAKEIKRVGTQALVFFPGMGLILGWPLIARKAVNGHL